MNSFFEYFKQNPQIGAAIITALFGFVGVFLNIIINVYFRSIDYKNKNRIEYLKIMECFYVPLELCTNNLLSSLFNIKQQNCISKIFNDAKYSSDINNINSAITKFKSLYSANTRKYVGDYKLYVYQEKCFKELNLIEKYINQRNSGDLSDNVDNVIIALKNLSQRIKRQRNILFSKNFIAYLIKKLFDKT